MQHLLWQIKTLWNFIVWLPTPKLKFKKSPNLISCWPRLILTNPRHPYFVIASTEYYLKFGGFLLIQILVFTSKHWSFKRFFWFCAYLISSRALNFQHCKSDQKMQLLDTYVDRISCVRRYLGNPLHVGVQQLHFLATFASFKSQKILDWKKHYQRWNSLLNDIVRSYFNDKRCVMKILQYSYF